MRPATLCAGAVALLLPALRVQAQVAAKAPVPIDGPSFMPMVLSLLVILALLGAAVWVLRRAGIAPRGGGSQLRVVAQLPLGPRDRVVIVEAGERWWLLGVGSGGVTRLGTLPKGQLPAGELPVASFGALLDKMRGGRS